jgi:RimJ/RimL family protein N-acetyltransferase
VGGYINSYLAVLHNVTAKSKAHSYNLIFPLSASLHSSQIPWFSTRAVVKKIHYTTPSWSLWYLLPASNSPSSPPPHREALNSPGSTNSAVTRKAMLGGNLSFHLPAPQPTDPPPSLYGPSKTPEETEKALQNMLAAPHVDGKEKTHRIPYAVHELLPPNAEEREQGSKFIGLITLRSLSETETQHPPRLGHASTPTTLSLELAYMFLPSAWGSGYASESINALFSACGRAPRDIWEPWQKVVVRAIVHDENVPSQRVMEKCGTGEKEVLEFEGGRFFLGGKWYTRHRLFVYEREVV